MNHPASPDLSNGVARRRPGWLSSTVGQCVVLGLIGFVARLPALQGEPVWDDDYLIRVNPFIKSPLLIFESFRHYVFQDTFTAAYRPVQNLSYLLDYFVWNSNFYGFHLTSLICHVASGVLLYLLLRRLLALSTQFHTAASIHSPDPGSLNAAAFFIALLWVVHPVHSGAVDYVSGRADSLAFVFACSAWLLVTEARTVSGRATQFFLIATSWVCALLALCSRETGIVWLLIFCGYTALFDRSASRRAKVLSIGGSASVLLAYLCLRQLPGPASLPDDASDATPPLLRLVLMFRSLGDYARLLVFPANLHMERTVYDVKAYQSSLGRWNAMEHEYLAITGLTVIAVFAVMCVRPGRGRPLRLFGTMWFFVAYLPISNLITLNATVAEHWLYLPSVGALMFLTGCVVDLPSRARRAAVAFGCVAVIALGVRSGYRSSDWMSNETFARRTLMAGGTTMRVVLLLANSYAARGDYSAAEQLLRKAVQLAPEYPMARNNLADALAHQGKQREAEQLFARSTEAADRDRKEYPRTWVAALNFARMRHEQKDDAAAVTVLEKARETYPQTWDLISAESELLRDSGNVERALQLVRDFASGHWWHYRAWVSYGRLLAQRGEVETAAAALRHASWLDIHETAALNLIAVIRMGESKLDEACRIQKSAVARQPDEPRQYLLLSTILQKMGRPNEAQIALAHVSRLKETAGTGRAPN